VRTRTEIVPGSSEEDRGKHVFKESHAEGQGGIPTISIWERKKRAKKLARGVWGKDGGGFFRRGASGARTVERGERERKGSLENHKPFCLRNNKARFIAVGKGEKGFRIAGREREMGGRL